MRARESFNVEALKKMTFKELEDIFGSDEKRFQRVLKLSGVKKPKEEEPKVKPKVKKEKGGE